MIRQLGLLTFFFIFTSIKRLWDPLIKALHTLYASKLNLPNKIKKLLICSYRKIDVNWTCHISKYYNHKKICFCKLITKDHKLFGYIFEIFIIKFQNHGSKHDHRLLWIKNAPMYGMHTNIKKWTIYKHVYFLWCIIDTKPITKCTTTSTHMYM
jgi:hypothetical protein